MPDAGLRIQLYAEQSRRSALTRHDVIIVGSGIVGLAHALAATRRGKKVLVLDRDAQPNGASIRNFGFVTVTGQERGYVWSLAKRSAAVWREVAAAADIAIEQQGLLLVAQRPEAMAVVEAFLATDMGEGCDRLSRADIETRYPMIQNAVGGLFSSHDVRVESRLAIPRLARWLAEEHGVEFMYGVAVHTVGTGAVESTAGTHRADAVFVCPGDDWATLFPHLYATEGITRCKLQMLRLASPCWRLPAPVMSDLSMVRYLGYAALPEAAPLRALLDREADDALAHGIHLIVVQSADGSLVVGDNHDYAPTPDPFTSTAIDALILETYKEVLGAPPPIVARWTGTYASAAGHSIVRTPVDGVRLIVVTSGTGASTSFALADDVVGEFFGE